MTTHVLILCTHNSARSVLAEGMLNHLAAKLGKDVSAHSAGSAPVGRINPFAIEALNNAGVDTTYTRSKSWDEFSAEGGDEGKRRAFELTRQAIGYRMLQLLDLPLEDIDRVSLQAALARIARS